ncbi:major facilitator transporter [Methanobrevibacter sp. YE315]|uniref:MFS transporter n=1 Tax=Methanobrevibacter sp. YE315 TaxID=1609968 RepID=UPI000764D868|nr:MFS transporter [Methanobrevibacter sp. YE315]AMD17290.1 major facilitator transporter [Methanobrevibacter sp. YE315]
MEKIEKFVILVSFITSFSTVFLIYSTILATPTIGKDFAMNNVVQNWIITIFLMILAAFTIPSGQICGKFGCKKIFVAGCLVIILGLIVSCISISPEMFLASRVIHGIGLALYLVAETAMLVLAIDKKHRGKSLGLVIVGTYLGYTTSPLIAGFLINNFGWRSIYYFILPFMIVCTIFTFLKIDEEWITNENDKMDLIGSLLYVIGICLFIYGFSDLLTFTGKLSVIIGILTLVIFGIYEYRHERPVFKIKLFKNKTFAAYNLTGFFALFAMAVFDVIFNYYYQYAKGWDPQFTGYILIISSIILAIISPNAGRLSDRILPQKISTMGLVILLIPIVGLIFLDVNTPTYIVIIAMALLAVGTGFFSIPNTNAVVSSVSDECAPYAAATQITLRSCGQTLSLGLLTLICSFVMGNLPLSQENAGLLVASSRIIAVICTVLCIVAIVFSIWGIRSDKSQIE